MELWVKLIDRSFYIISIFLFLWLQKWFEFIVLFITVLILKQVIQEQRPDGSDWHSFPSGHAAISWFLAGIHPIGSIWAILVSYSRIVLKKHYLHDVIAGAILGLYFRYFIILPIV
jgi:membrane-associated phospholipid phosphatase